jgi:sugar phosphate permease
MNGWLPTYYQEHFHLSQGTAGFASTGYPQIAALLGVLAGGAWADRWSRTNPRARMLVPAIGLCLAVPGIILMARTDVLIFAIAGMVSHTFFKSFSDSNMMPILCLVADPRYRATGYGVLNCLSCVVGGVAIYAGGALRDAHIGLSNIFLFAAGTVLGCAVLVFLIKPRAEVAVDLRATAVPP